MKKTLFAGACTLVFALLLLSTNGCSMTDSVNDPAVNDTMPPLDTGLIDNGLGDSAINVDKGVVIVSERTRDLVFVQQSAQYVVGLDTVSLQSIRDEIAKENMSLSAFTISDLIVVSKPAFSDFIAANASVPIIMTISTSKPGIDGSELIAVQSPDTGMIFPQRTLGDLTNGLRLNDGLYANAAGFSDFENLIKNSTQPDVIITVTITSSSTLVIPEGFTLTFTIEGTSKK